MGRAWQQKGSRTDSCKVTSNASEQAAFRALISLTLLKNKEDENETLSVLGRTSRVNSAKPDGQEVSGRGQGSGDSHRFGACLGCRRKSTLSSERMSDRLRAGCPNSCKEMQALQRRRGLRI